MMNAAPAQLADAVELDLREEDASEVSDEWRAELADAISRGDCTTCRDPDGRLVGIFGVTKFGAEVAPWLLCSSLAVNHRIAIWRIARHTVAHLRSHEGLTFNYIPKDSHRNRAFVLALGFRILPSPRDGFDLFYLPHV